MLFDNNQDYSAKSKNENRSDAYNVSETDKSVFSKLKKKIFDQSEIDRQF